MPDFHKCTNEQCKLKENCLRWTEKPSLMQSYIRFQPRKTDCEYQKKKDKMKNFNFRWTTYKRLKYIKDTDSFFSHIHEYLKWCQTSWRAWELSLGIKTPWGGNIKDRNHDFNAWLELRHPQVQG